MKTVRAIALAVACGGAIASCGGDEPDPAEQVGATLAALRADFDAGRVERACARTTLGPRCRATVRHLVDRGTPNHSRMRSGERRVTDVEVRGPRATATVTLNERVDGSLRFVRRGGDWKLAGLGVKPDLERSRWKDAPASEGPSPPDPTPLACPPITRYVHRGHSAVGGGCELRFSSDDVAIVMLSAFDDVAVARCSAGFTVHVAANTTATLADQIEFRGPGACGRIRRCRDGETGLRYPWQVALPRGRLANGMHLRFDICVNTPFGRARGMFHYRLVRRGSEVIAQAYDFPIGDRSIQFVGTWDVDPGDFERLPARAKPRG